MDLNTFEEGDDGALSVVIPVYRSEAILPGLISELVRELEALGRPFEIILVEDCGGDGSWDLITAFALRDNRVRGFRLSRNYGQHNATLCGIRAARYDTIVTMDDDMQHPPDQVAELVAMLDKGCDVVYGVPQHQQHGLLRDFASWVTKLALESAMGAKNARNVSAFRAFRARLRRAFDNYQSPWVSIDVLLSWATRNFGVVVMQHRPRPAGQSNYSLGSLMNHAFNMITGFSTLPLRIVSIVGFSFTVFGFGLAVWVLGRYVAYGSVVPGFVFLAMIITIFSGVQLFSLGIFGEYLGRIFGRTIEQPAYVVMDEVGECDVAPVTNTKPCTASTV